MISMYFFFKKCCCYQPVIASIASPSEHSQTKLNLKSQTKICKTTVWFRTDFNFGVVGH